ncbi:hypothetical protein Tsubulata_040520 [Turnera subulata]|uniref:Uncharacterized protein n=1 Tax=Turnera subulata TaxID=218843 RepID=A0A9Q0G0A0_9ROSI|nr:hypothetical protein Tsubulata_040520 [Turnera subulata]
MLLSLVQTIYASPFQSNQTHTNALLHKSDADHLNPSAAKTLQTTLLYPTKKKKSATRKSTALNATIHASLFEAPLAWAGRLCIYYALLRIGWAGSMANPLVRGLDDGADVFVDDDDVVSGGCDDLGFSKLTETQKCIPDEELSEKRKSTSAWVVTPKGTLKRKYRVPSITEGRRVLKAISSFLSDDDHFRDAATHKGCQIRRQSAHSESVCCNNVRALFDELRTPHLVVEITPFPAGPLTQNDYIRAEKLGRFIKTVLQS